MIETIEARIINGATYILDGKGDIWKFSIHWDKLPRIELICRGNGKITDKEITDFLKANKF